MMEELEGFLKENEIEIAAAYNSEVQSAEVADLLVNERDQGHLEFCTYGSDTSEGCHCGECTSCRTV